MKIGVANAGNIGRSLAAPWLRAGHDLLLATQGSPDKLDAFLRQFPAARGGGLTKRPASAISFYSPYTGLASSQHWRQLMSSPTKS